MTKLTIDFITREFVAVLVHGYGLEAEYVPIKAGLKIPGFGEGVVPEQRNVDFMIKRKDLNKALDDVSQKWIEPAAGYLLVSQAAGELARELRGLKKTYQLVLPSSKGIESYLHVFHGVAVRGIQAQSKFDHEADMFRFDVLFTT